MSDLAAVHENEPGTEKVLIILSPPRSFSSVVSTMIGQHPDLYGFPELHLFIGDTVQEVLDREYQAGNYFGPPGLLRAIAQLEYGHQTKATVARAIGWLAERRTWPTKDLMDYLRARVAPLIAIEKSPVTALRPIGLERAWTYYPKAYFLHLTRHPVSTRQSMQAFFNRRLRQETSPPIDSLLSWYRFHFNILEFTRELPPGQSLTLKGEDILSNPDLYLPQIAEWIGVRTDTTAIEAMKHPEHSAYAYRGPSPADGGNDSNFMHDPVLKPGRVAEPSLKDFFAQPPPAWIHSSEHQCLSDSGFALVAPEVLMGEISALAHRLGYR